MQMNLRYLLSIWLLVFFTQTATAQISDESWRKFLSSCAYGTAAGGILGLASLAFTDDPGGKTVYIARGASLGLYAGIGWGLYSIYTQKDSASQDLAWTIMPLENKGQLDGGQFLFLKRFF